MHPKIFPENAITTVATSKPMLEKRVSNSKFMPTLAKKNGTMKPNAISSVTFTMSFL